MRKTLLVMAAGMGSRYGGLKQIEGFGPSGELLLEYSLFDARRAGFDAVVFLVQEQNAALLRERIGERAARFFDVRYAFQRLDDVPAGFSVPAERVKPWGTAHAVLSCREMLDGPFAVINADDFYGPDAFRLLAGWMDTAEQGNVPEFCMAAYPLRNTLTENGHVSRGVCRVGEDGFLLSVVERTKIQRRGGLVEYEDAPGRWEPLDENSPVSMNCWGFPASFPFEAAARFAAFLEKNGENLLWAEYFLPSVVQEMLDEGRCRVRVLRTDGQWFGVTYREDRETVVRALAERAARGDYPEPLWRRESRV